MLITTLLQRLRGLIRSLFRRAGAAPLLLLSPPSALRPVPVPVRPEPSPRPRSRVR
jgi:hypothetical protein